jgi:hypothetical protein
VKRIGWIAVLMGLAMGNTLMAQRGEATASINGKKVTIEYGRPSLQGRDMLARLPVGNTWRMGKDAATTLKTDGTLHFGAQTVAPGTYRLTAKRVSEDAWHLLISSDENTVEIPLQNNPAGESVETFTINLESKGGNQGRFSMAWGMMTVGTDFTVE